MTTPTSSPTIVVNPINYRQLQTEHYYIIDPKQTDTASTFQLALTSMFNLMAGQPGTIILPDKKIPLSAPIVLGYGQCLRGIGSNS
jgi:hypothetical protein